MTDLQLASIISQAMFVGEVYGKKTLDIDSDNSVREDDLIHLGDEEARFRNYARGMLDFLMKELNVQNRERVIEKALKDFFAMNGY